MIISWWPQHKPHINSNSGVIKGFTTNPSLMKRAGITDYEAFAKEAAAICHEKEGTELLWASSRELFNIFQADECGCDIITCTLAILSKLPLEEISLDTVQMFNRDIQSLGYSIL